MDEIIERLMQNRDSSEAKSYLIGLERGRIWAEDTADYFDIRQWSEVEIDELDEIVLPPDEERYYVLIEAETPLEWPQYARGWIDGVKQILDRY
jgi:hypothetical protein